MNGKKLTGFMLLFLFTDIDKVEKDGYGFVSEYCDKEGETIPMSTTFLLALNLYDHKIEAGLHPRDIEEIPYEYQRCFLCKKIQL